MRALFLFLAMALASTCFAGFVDSGGNTDSRGSWEFDLYDASGNQRGTNANPFFFSLNGGPYSFGRTWSLSSTTDSIIQPDITATGTITNTQSVAMSISGSQGISVQLSGTWAGTITFEVSIDGTTWAEADVFSDAFNGELVEQTATTNGGYSFVNVAGQQQVRVRGSTVTSGTLNVTIRGNQVHFNYPIFARGLGDPIGSYGVQLGGVDATTNTFQFQKVNTLGAAGVYLESSNKANYRATVVPLTPAATPTDIITLCGSATKVVRGIRIVLNTTQTTQGINDWYLVKRSTANTGGTSTVVTPVPSDSAFAAATATYRRYTTNPTALGTLVGNVSIVNVLSAVSAPASSSATAYIPYVFDFTNNSIVLRGVAECLALNFNGAALPAGLSVNSSIEWTEE